MVAVDTVVQEITRMGTLEVAAMVVVVVVMEDNHRVDMVVAREEIECLSLAMV